MNDADASRSRLGMYVILGLTLVLCAASLLQVLANDLIWDDEFLILGADGLGDPARLGELLARPFWQNSSYVAGLLHDYWRPVTTFVLWVGAFVFGEWAPGFHLISVIGALAAAVAFFALARRLVDREHHPVALWLALIFLMHPLGAEVLCMVANVSDHLCFAFLALAVMLFLDELERGGARWRLPLAGLCALLACGSKELGVVAVGAPLAAWLLRRTVDPTLPKKLLLRPLVWAASLIPAVMYLVARGRVTETAGHVKTYLPEAGQYAWNVFLGLGQAIRQIVVPMPGGANTYIEGDSAVPIIVAALAWLAVVALLVWTAVRTRAWRLPAIGALLALVLLLPSLLSADRFGHALRFPTRYFHLPLAGALIAALPYAVRAWSKLLRFAAPVLVALLALLSWMRIGEWRDSVSFFYAETIYHPQSAPDLLNLVRAMTNARAFNEAEKVLDRAERLPVAQEPSMQAKLLNDRAAIALLRDGDVERGSKYLEIALSIEPSDLANVLDLAAARATAGRPDQSVIVLRKALDSPWFRDYRRSAIEARLERYRKMAGEKKAGDIEPEVEK